MSVRGVAMLGLLASLAAVAGRERVDGNHEEGYGTKEKAESLHTFCGENSETAKRV